jgi:hypothetical protein
MYDRAAAISRVGAVAVEEHDTFPDICLQDVDDPMKRHNFITADDAEENGGRRL